MDPHRLQAFMKGGAGEFTTTLPAQMKESARELLETTWQTPSVLPMASHKRQHCFCGWTVYIMRSQCANSAIGSWLASFLAAQMDQQKRSFGKIVPSGPRRVTCFFHCGVITVFLIDLYHYIICADMTGDKPTPPRSPQRIHLPSNSAEAASDPFFPPGPDRGLVFTNSFFTFGREGSQVKVFH